MAESLATVTTKDISKPKDDTNLAPPPPPPPEDTAQAEYTYAQNSYYSSEAYYQYYYSNYYAQNPGAAAAQYPEYNSQNVAYTGYGQDQSQYQTCDPNTSSYYQQYPALSSTAAPAKNTKTTAPKLIEKPVNTEAPAYVTNVSNNKTNNTPPKLTSPNKLQTAQNSSYSIPTDFSVPPPGYNTFNQDQYANKEKNQNVWQNKYNSVPPPVNRNSFKNQNNSVKFDLGKRNNNVLGSNPLENNNKHLKINEMNMKKQSRWAPVIHKETIQNDKEELKNGAICAGLKRFMKRCFESSTDSGEVERVLNDRLRLTVREGNQLNIDWDNEPIPDILQTESRNPPKNTNINPLLTPFKNNAHVPFKTTHPNIFKDANKNDTRNSFNNKDGGSVYKKSPPTKYDSVNSPFKKIGHNNYKDNNMSNRRDQSKSTEDSRYSSYKNRSSYKDSACSSESSEEDYPQLTMNNRLGNQKQQLSKRKQKLLRKQNKKKAKMIQLQKAAENNKSRKLIKYTFDFGPDNEEKLKSRSERFHNQLETPSKTKFTEINKLSYSNDVTELDWDDMTIIGTNMSLEKKYLRLTKRPEADTIRPLKVLVNSLECVKNKWKENSDYHYACEQMKSIRQDLTADHQEFNQCQTQLKALYKDNDSPNKNEFTAYEIIYNIFVNNTLEISSILRRLSREERKDSDIGFAMKLRTAWTLDNFCAFFELYKDTPAMTGYIIDWFADNQRSAALNHILKSFVTRTGSLGPPTSPFSV